MKGNLISFFAGALFVSVINLYLMNQQAMRFRNLDEKRVKNYNELMKDRNEIVDELNTAREDLANARIINTGNVQQIMAQRQYIKKLEETLYQ